MSLKKRSDQLFSKLKRKKMKTKHLLTGTLTIAAGLLLNSFMLVSDGYKVGDKAIDFKLKNTNGKMVSLGDYKEAKGFIVTFTCNHCPFAKMYEERIMALDKKYAAKGYPVIAINSNDPVLSPEDSYDNMVARAKQKDYSFPYLFDETQDIARSYGATNTPHLYVLSKENGVLLVKYIGAIDDNAQDAAKATKHYVEDAVNALLENKPVTVAQTKAIGCTIKWRKNS
jgi:peroxiredoxin